MQLLAALSAGATSALLVILAERHLGTGPGGFGLLLGAIGAGAALGPLLLARLTADPRRPVLVFGPYLLRGAVDLILATTRDLPVAMAALGLYGVATSTGMVTYTPMLQAEVPAQTRGWVFAGFDMIWQTGRLTPWGWAAWPPTPSASRPSTSWVALCSCSQAPSAWPGCRPSTAPTTVRGPDDRHRLLSHSPPSCLRRRSRTGGPRRG